MPRIVPLLALCLALLAASPAAAAPDDMPAPSGVSYTAAR